MPFILIIINLYIHFHFRTKVPHTQNHSETQKINSDSVTVKSVAVIKNPKSDIQANNEMRNDENKETKTKINNAKTETKKPSTKKETVLQVIFLLI